MRSIRRSLILYFLVLLALALGAVGLFVNRVKRQTLEVRHQAAVELLDRQYEERAREEKAKLDQKLLNQANHLASLAQWQYFQRFRKEGQRYYTYITMAPLAAGLAAQSPYGYLTMPSWIFPAKPTSFALGIARVYFTNLQLDELFVHSEDDPGIAEYVQINSAPGSIWRSRSLGNMTMPLDLRQINRSSFVSWKFDDLQLNNGITVRRVLLKTPLVTAGWGRPMGMRSAGGERRGPPPFAPGLNPPSPNLVVPPPMIDPFLQTVPPSSAPGDAPRRPSERSENYLPTIYIQCAYDLSSLNETLAGLAAERDLQIRRFKEETQQTLRRLQELLLLVSLGTFAGVVLGGSLLVGQGLKPLNRLSEAVSQVSTKDFRLPIDQTKLPRELRPIAERMAETLRLLQKAFDREKQAAADISHELRTPVAALLTTVEVALRKPRSPEEYRETLEDCRTISQQMSQLVERLLLLARIDAGSDPVNLQPVDVADLVDSCVPVVRPLAEERGLKFSIGVEAGLEACTDPVKLREVLINLLHNAVEYNRPGGSVELIGRRLDSHRLMLEVRDTGIGMTPETREHIFERFYRSDPSRNGTGAHAGLGLAIVKEYVDRLGGGIEVESTIGVGSCFRVKLPLQGRSTE